MKKNNKKKDIVLITHYYHFPSEKESSRYRTLAEMIANDQRFSLELVTSSFYHRTKQQREKEDCICEEPFKVTLIEEPDYKKNISLKRLYSAKIFAKNVVEYLKKRRQPDLIYQVVPSLDVADYVSRFAVSSSIPLAIDIQDLWPEAFKMAIDIPVISNILFYPMKKQANRIYCRADQIIAVSDTYVKRAMSVNSKCQQGIGVYIGTDIEFAKRKMGEYKIEKPQKEFWITYVGALGHSYDINLIIKAIARLKERGIKNIVFHIMGTGVLMEKFKKKAADLDINAIFHGQVEYGLMMAMLSKSDIAINPIVGKSVASIINKVSDYAVAQIPVINTQKCEEYKMLLDRYNAGINCRAGNINEVSEAIEKLYENAHLRDKMKKGEQILANEKFNRQSTYPIIVDALDRLCTR
ncbi:MULTISPECIES: glycosyltransferase [Eubacteriales]|uniref:glycosyltransferase n=1 Tax=Eubacteriales TaxID=186802 RepID=UPI0011070128|nr:MULTISPECIES: glycosyltransferase [Eubacteriales]